jgi:hypothetical protein
MPQEGVPGARPRPRKLNADSASTDTAKTLLAPTITIGITFGTTCRIKIQLSLAPSDLDASM